MSKKIKKMLGEVNALASQGEMKEAKAICKKVIKRIKEKGLEEENDYDNLFAHYFMMKYYEPRKDEKSQEKRLKYSKKCYKMVHQGSIFHFTDRGQFEEEVVRCATNNIAWRMYETESDTAKLEEALEIINNGLEYAYDGSLPKENYLFMFDTKVRLLLKLGRKQEAYTLVYEVLEVDAFFGDFDDIRELPEFNEFISKMQVDFNEEEKEFLAKAKRIVSNIKKEVIPADANTSNDAKVEIIGIGECSKKYDFPEMGFDWDKGTCLVVEGDLYIEGDLDDEWIKKQREKYSNEHIESLLVKGNLYVKGDILDAGEGDGTLIIQINGDVYAEYICSEDGFIEVLGTTVVRLGAYGEYNHGVLDTHGGLEAPFIFANDHAMDRESTIESIYMEAGDGEEKFGLTVGRAPDGDCGWGWTYFDKGYRFLKPEVWDEKHRLDLSKFFDMVKQGVNPFVELEDM